MALYHLTARPLSRARRNTVQAVAYRAGCQLQDIRSLETFNYRHKVAHGVELLLPQDAPAWAHTLKEAIQENRESGVQVFVEMAEAAEKRCDARLYREIEFALPVELTDEQCVTLAKSFINRALCSQGICVLANFHLEHDEKTQTRKPHCHALLLTRKLASEGLAIRKETAWDHVDFLKGLREAWAEELNAALLAHGHQSRVDHRSYAEQGIALEPQPKRSRQISRIEEKREKEKTPQQQTSPSPFLEKHTNRANTFEQVKLRNLYRIISHPELIFEVVTHQYATFMWGDVQRVLARYVDDTSLFQRLDARLRASKELVQLHADEHESQHVYTTRALLKTEKRLIQNVDTLVKAENSHALDAAMQSVFFEKAATMLREQHAVLLSEEQEAFVRYMTSPGALKYGTGYAGTGKTTALLACQSIWESAGFKVYGLTPTGRAASLLNQKGLPTMTLDKFLKNYEGGRCQYHKNSILVLDEAGMVDVRRFETLMRAVRRLNVKLVCIGDEGQLKPIEAGDAFKLIRQSLPEKALLSQIVRQKIDWQKEATLLFGSARTQEALALYLKHQCVHFVQEESPTQDLRFSTRHALLKTWEASLDDHSTHSHLMLSFARHDVSSLNAGAREILKGKGLIKGREFTHTISREEEDDFGRSIVTHEQKRFALGDRVVFLRNDTGLGVQNGCLGTVVKSQSNTLQVKLDDEADQVVSFAPQLYPWFDHGWALTVHKSQGTTVDRTFVLASGRFSRNLSYVALSRHREEAQIFASKAEFPNEGVFLQKMSRTREKLVSRDYLSSDQVEHLMRQDDDLFTRVLRPLGDKLEAMGYVSKRVVMQVAEKVLKIKGPDFHDSYVQPSLSEERRAEALFGLGISSRSSEENVFSHAQRPQSWNPKQQERQPFYDRQQVLDSLSASRIEHFFQAHLSQWVERPVMRRYGDQIRYGTKGGFVVNPLKGEWYDHYTGKGGDLFRYLEYSRGIPYTQAIREVAESVGLSGSYPILENAEVQKRWATLEKEKQQAEVQKRQSGRKKAEALFKETRPLTGTVAEVYLRAHRHILCELSSDLRYNDARPTAEGPHPALIAFARDRQGNLSGFQEIFLDQESGAKATLKLVKKSGGAIKGAAVRIQEDTHNREVTFIAEGLETALSVKAAGLEGEILCGLGRTNFKALEPSSKTIVLCADWDGEGAKTHEALLKDQEHLQNKGYTVHIVWPAQSGSAKIDFNDILKTQGSDGVRALFEAQVPEICTPHQSREEAQAACYAYFEKEPFVSWSQQGKKKLHDLAHNDPLTLLRNLSQREVREDFHAYHEAIKQCASLLTQEPFTQWSVKFHEEVRKLVEQDPHGTLEGLQKEVHEFEEKQQHETPESSQSTQHLSVRQGQHTPIHPVHEALHQEMIHTFELER